MPPPWYKGKGLGIRTIFLLGFRSIKINKDLVMHRQAKISDKNRRFGVFMTPLSRRKGKVQGNIFSKSRKLLAYSKDDIFCFDVT